MGIFPIAGEMDLLDFKEEVKYAVQKCKRGASP